MSDEEKNAAAQEMVGIRWAKTSPKQRSEHARKMNEARWAGHVAKRPASSRKKAAKKKAAKKKS